MTVLLAPHADDETLFACFQILRHRPKVIICTRALVQYERGYTFTRDGVEEPITAAQREVETQAAMEVLGVEDWEVWDIPDNGDFSVPVLYRNIRLLAEDHYHCIAPMFEKNGHDHHNSVALAAEVVFLPSEDGDRLTRYSTYTRYSGRSRRGEAVEFEPHWPALKHRALACYESQIQHPSTRDHFIGDLHEYVL